MSKLVLKILNLTLFLFCVQAHAFTVQFTDWDGVDHQKYLKVPMDRSIQTMTIWQFDIIENCGGGSTVLNLIPDPAEVGYLFVTFSGPDGVPPDDRTWMFNGQTHLSLPPIGTSAHVKATTRWCPGDITLTVRSSYPYPYYRNDLSQCVVAQTFDDAVCREGCQHCVARVTTDKELLPETPDIRSLQISPFVSQSPK